jgi:hypothetical protein
VGQSQEWEHEEWARLGAERRGGLACRSHVYPCSSRFARCSDSGIAPPMLRDLPEPAGPRTTLRKRATREWLTPIARAIPSSTTLTSEHLPAEVRDRVRRPRDPHALEATFFECHVLESYYAYNLPVFS